MFLVLNRGSNSFICSIEIPWPIPITPYPVRPSFTVINPYHLSNSICCKDLRLGEKCTRVTSSRLIYAASALRQGNLKTSFISTVRPTVHTICHENAALFLRLGLPSTLIRHENAALFLQLGLPTTLIRHENAAF